MGAIAETITHNVLSDNMTLNGKRHYVAKFCH